MEMCVRVGSWMDHMYDPRGRLRKRNVCSRVQGKRAVLSGLQSPLNQKVYKEEGRVKRENSVCIHDYVSVCMCEANGGKMWKVIDNESIGSGKYVDYRLSIGVHPTSSSGGMIS